MPNNTLLVFAHADEAEAFAAAGLSHLITGVGKINATLALTEALVSATQNEDRPAYERVVVLGTAGALSDAAKLHTVYQIEAVLQHDFSLSSPTIVPGGEILVSNRATIATGDIFVQNDEQREALAARGATLVDMESYAFAAVCERLGVPLQIFKVPSDFADSSTTMDEWDAVVVSKSHQLFEFARKHLPELIA